VKCVKIIWRSRDYGRVWTTKVAKFCSKCYHQVVILEQRIFVFYTTETRKDWETLKIIRKILILISI